MCSITLLCQVTVYPFFSKFVTSYARYQRSPSKPLEIAVVYSIITYTTVISFINQQMLTDDICLLHSIPHTTECEIIDRKVVLIVKGI